MPYKKFEIVDGPSLTIRARLKHGPGDLHSVEISPEDALALRGAFRRHIMRLQPKANVSGEGREEDMSGVDRPGGGKR